jgi:hypothetical protein
MTLEKTVIGLLVIVTVLVVFVSPAVRLPKTALRPLEFAKRLFRILRSLPSQVIRQARATRNPEAVVRCLAPIPPLLLNCVLLC